jgi:hypothetical protein
LFFVWAAQHALKTEESWDEDPDQSPLEGREAHIMGMVFAGVPFLLT